MQNISDNADLRNTPLHLGAGSSARQQGLLSGCFRSHFGSSDLSTQGNQRPNPYGEEGQRIAAMQCPICNQIRYRKEWSKIQWSMEKVRVVGGGGWWQNCCRQCSDEQGYYFTATCIRPRVNRWTKNKIPKNHLPHDLARMREDSVGWLKENIPSEFWLLVDKHYRQVNKHHATELALLQNIYGISKLTYRIAYVTGALVHF